MNSIHILTKTIQKQRTTKIITTFNVTSGGILKVVDNTKI